MNYCWAQMLYIVENNHFQADSPPKNSLLLFLNPPIIIILIADLLTASDIFQGGRKSR